MSGSKHLVAAAGAAAGDAAGDAAGVGEAVAGAADEEGEGDAEGFVEGLAAGLADGLGAAFGGPQIRVSWPYLAKTASLMTEGCAVEPGFSAASAPDHELPIDLDLRKQLLHLDGEVLTVLRRVLLLVGHPRPAEVLVEGEAEQHQEGDAHHQEGAPYHGFPPQVWGLPSTQPQSHTNSWPRKKVPMMTSATTIVV